MAISAVSTAKAQTQSPAPTASTGRLQQAPATSKTQPTAADKVTISAKATALQQGTKTSVQASTEVISGGSTAKAQATRPTSETGAKK